MTTYNTTAKNTTTFNSVSKRVTGAGEVFFGWLFWFTQPGNTQTVYNTTTKNTTNYSTINKN